ncbi:MAG: 30S ribosomal protein S1 [Deltaproteobacteria bacterium]|nr:30S ribosomal protein S1 [Deltaproteobacteria bacterium]MBW2069881.1 30S ribosomal protein S1 [Deltaproteobacteria bacterium]
MEQTEHKEQQLQEKKTDSEVVSEDREEQATETSAIEEEAAQPAAATEQGKEETAAEEVAETETESEMSDVEDEDEAQELDSERTTFQEMYEESLKSIKEGEVVRGTIIQVTDDYVMVDIGYKSEGQIPVSEFLDEKGNLAAKVGDSVDVLLERREDDEGTIVLSKEKAAKIKVWDEISRIYNEDGVIEGTISSKVKGGLSVDIGIQAFLPGSQVDLRPVRNLDSLIGQTYSFKILKYNRKRRNVVLSRRVLLEKEREILKAETLKNLEEGKILEGTVKNITEYGVFVDLGGIDGLLHITDMSWGRVGHPSELCSFGDRIKVMVLSFDPERERVSLGLKQLHEDPWNTVDERYPVGSRITGKVVSLTDYGAFVELEPGIEGLIHVSEMSWTAKIRHPSKVVSVGDVVEAVVLNLSKENRRISLGMKQVEPNPWDIIGEKYPVGTTIQGKIKNITDFGLFIGIDEGIDGLVHISDLSWTKRVKHPSELYKKGQEIQAVVLNIDKDHERFSLGVKQLEPDPWEEIPQRYPVGSTVVGTVTNVTDFGLFVEIEEGIEGLVHVSEISREKIKTPVGTYKEGDEVTAKVVNIGQSERKIGLSIKRLEEQDEKTSYYEYVNSPKAATSNLGQLLKEELEGRASQLSGGEDQE